MIVVEEKKRRRPCISQLSKGCTKFVLGTRADRICFACAQLIRIREESQGASHEKTYGDLGIFEKVRAP